MSRAINSDFFTLCKDADSDIPSQASESGVREAELA